MYNNSIYMFVIVKVIDISCIYKKRGKSMSDYKDGFSSNSKSELIYEKHYTDEHELVYIKLRCPKDNSEMKVTHTAKIKKKKDNNIIIMPIYTCAKCSKSYTSMNEHSDGQEIKIDDASYTNLLAKSHSVNYYRADSAHTRILYDASFYVYKGVKQFCSNPYCKHHKLKGVYVMFNHFFNNRYRKTVEYIKWCSKCNLYYVDWKKKDYIDWSFEIINYSEIDSAIKEELYLKKEQDRANRKRVAQLREINSKRKRNKKIEKQKKKTNTIVMTPKVTEIEKVTNNYIRKEDHVIGAKDFVIKSNIFRCKGEKHKLEDITAIISVVDKNGNVQEKKVSAGFCSSCGVYFIIESVYEELKRIGVPLCRISDTKTFFSSNDYNYMHLASESVLRQFGYNVSNNNELTEKARHKILAVIIDKNILTKNEIIAYLDFFINQRKYNDKFYMAIAKWETDRNFVSNYKLGDYESYGVNGLYR